VKNKKPNPDHNIGNSSRVCEMGRPATNCYGTYWCHYTVHEDDYTKKRIRVSLGTKDIKIARALRDFLMDATPKVATNIPLMRGQARPDASPDVCQSRAVARPHEYRAAAMTH
jgi:hypothetical protein